MNYTPVCTLHTKSRHCLTDIFILVAPVPYHHAMKTYKGMWK